MVQCLRLQDAIVGVEGVILVGLLKSYMLFRAAKDQRKGKKKKKKKHRRNGYLQDCLSAKCSG